MRRAAFAMLLAVVAAAVAACGSSTPPAKPAPSGRTGAAAVFDEKRQELILFGGADRAGHALGDTWAYDTKGWHQLAAGKPGPSPREGASFAYNPEAAEDVLVGGHNGSAHDDDTWIWNGTAWSRGAALDAPAHDATAMTVTLNRSRRQLDMVMCCTTGGAATAIAYAGNGHVWNRQDPSFAGDPPVTPGATWLESAFDYSTGRVMVVGPGGAGAPPVSAAFDGVFWSRLGPLSDFPAGAHPHLFEAPDESDLLAVIDTGPGGPGVWRWDGRGWVAIAAKNLPATVVATAVDIRDGAGLVLGEASGAAATPSVLAWHLGRLQAPKLAVKKPLGEPTFGQATPSPTPIQVVKAARAYMPTPGELGIPALRYSTQFPPAAITGKDANGAGDAYETVYDAPGPKRVAIDVFVMPDDDSASSLAEELGTGSGDSKAQGQDQTTLDDGSTAYTFNEIVGSGEAQLFSVTWHVGRIVVSLFDRDYKGAITLDDALRIAEIVDAKTH